MSKLWWKGDNIQCRVFGHSQKKRVPHISSKIRSIKLSFLTFHQWEKLCQKVCTSRQETKRWFRVFLDHRNDIKLFYHVVEQNGIGWQDVVHNVKLKKCKSYIFGHFKGNIINSTDHLLTQIDPCNILHSVAQSSNFWLITSESVFELHRP